LLAAAIGLGTLHAQSDRALADSLIALLPTLPTDSGKVYVYRDIAYYLKELDPDSALWYAIRGEIMARGLDLTVGHIDNLFQQAFIWEVKERHDSSMSCFKRALHLAKASGDRSLEGKVLLGMGGSYYFQGHLSEAIAHFDQALTAYEGIDDPTAQAYALNNLGVIYRLRRDHAKAIAIYERSLRLKREQADERGTANTLYNLALAHAYSGNAERALPYFAEARDIFRTLGDSVDLMRTDVAEGVALHSLERYQEARPLLERGLDLPHRHLVERASALLHLGEEDLMQGRPKVGLQYLLDAHSTVEGTGRLDLMRQIEKALALGYDQIKDPTRAAPHWKAYAQLGDTLASEQRQWAIEEMQARYESREKDLTIRAQQEALASEGARRRLFLFSAALLALLLLVAALYARSRVRLNLRLRKALEEREWLLREMHHRVKNNLQMLNSLLSIQSRELADPGAREAMRESRGRVQAIGLIHQFLHGQDAFRSIAMRDYLTRLMEHLGQASGSDRQHIALHPEVDDLQLDVDLATPIGLMVNELVTNALKHAFPEGRKGHITVGLQGTNDHLVLTVQDDGIGLEGGAHDGFGHILLRTLAQRLKAEMSTTTDHGTRTTFTIPHKTNGRTEVHSGGGG